MVENSHDFGRLTMSVVTVAPGVTTTPASSNAASAASAGASSGTAPTADAHPARHTGSEEPEGTKGIRFHEVSILSSQAASRAEAMQRM